MIISYNWLSDYLPIKLEPGRLSNILTSIGLEVEKMEKFEEVKGGLDGLVIGEILVTEKHPNADEVKLDGLVVTNTTISREQLATGKEQIENIGAGGLSGKPLALRSTEMLLYINKKTQGRLPLIASGGIFNGNDTLEKLKAGAVLFEVWTGFIYEGPSIVKNICNALKN
jgi:hypothetical protein